MTTDDPRPRWPRLRLVAGLAWKAALIVSICYFGIKKEQADTRGRAAILRATAEISAQLEEMRARSSSPKR